MSQQDPSGVRLRIFNNSSAQDLEREVNDWLEINPDIQILLITQSESGKLAEDWGVTLTLLYREPHSPTGKIT